jgi:hypothetical protein
VAAKKIYDISSVYIEKGIRIIIITSQQLASTALVIVSVASWATAGDGPAASLIL